jgi:hypothetical protein
METISYIAAGIGFVVVTGYAVLNWLRRGRDPRVTDDPSILLAAPPEGMTAATATIVDHQPTTTAFMAALLDLASRDEVRFRAEAGGLVGIELRGGESGDPQVRLNRRRPIGEGEAWLLTQLKETPLVAASQAAGVGDGEPDPTAIAQGVGMMIQFLSFTAAEQPGDDSPEARAQREHGLLDAPPVDPQALASAVEKATGRPLSETQQVAFARMGFMTQALQDPASIAADPEAFAARVQALSGKPMSPKDFEEMKAWATRAAAGTPTSGSPATSSGTVPGGGSSYISGEGALHLGAPFLFGSFVENYARRHGWIGGLSFIKRLRWRLIGVGEIVVALILLAIGSSAHAEALTALGAGVGLGGFMTYLIAPAMIATTPEGALMRAEIAAYRRTLQMTFAASRSIGDALGASSLTWLETPDQSLVWGVALGLRTEIEALLARTAPDVQDGHPPPDAYRPAWYASAAGQPAPNLGAMFAGIEAIGSKPGSSQESPAMRPAGA